MLRFSLLVVVMIVGGIWHAASASAATVSHDVTTIDWSFVEPTADCLGEDVQVNGELHVMTNVVEDSAGGTHVVVSLNSSNLVGTGVTSGTVYDGSAGSHSEFSSRTSENEITTGFRLVLTSGSGASLVVHGTFHETVDANGTVRASVDVDHDGCSG